MRKRRVLPENAVSVLITDQEMACSPGPSSGLLGLPKFSQKPLRGAVQPKRPNFIEFYAKLGRRTAFGLPPYSKLSRHANRGGRRLLSLDDLASLATNIGRFFREKTQEFDMLSLAH
jgi:hypothetical protein